MQHAIIFCLFMLGQAIFINGVSIAASGHTDILPDGTEKDSDEILYPIKKWLEKTVDVRVYYTGARLEKLVEAIGEFFKPVDLVPDKIGDNYIRVENFDRQEVWRKAQVKIEKAFQVEMMNLPDTAEFTFSVIEKKYIRSKYLRMPTFGCVKCMASLWGTLTYWPFIIIMYGFHWQEFLIWSFDIVSLIAINFYISRILKK